MIAILFKSLRESWFATLLFGVGLAIVSGLIAYVLPIFAEELAAVWLQMAFARNLLSALLGVPIEDSLTGAMLQSLAWTHPVILALLWAHEVMHCTRTPAAEIDRGTVDLLLGLPIRRRTILIAESLVWLGTGVLLLCGVVIGTTIGTALAGAERAPAGRIALVVLNLLALYAAVGAFAYLVSCLSSRRGRAVGVVLGVLLASFLLNFLVPFWEPAERIAFLGVLDHYRPAHILTGRGDGVGGTITLACIATVCWAGALVAFSKRNIATL